MEIILPSRNIITLTPEQSQALQDEMKFACNNLSVFPVMEMILNGMET